MRNVIFVCVLLCLAITPVLSAPAGTAFTYQGKLTDASGAPMTGPHDLVLSLHDAAEMGNQVGSNVSLTGVSVTNGLFSVLLDFGSAPFNGQRLWLETVVNGTRLVPRTELTAVPYALATLTSPATGLVLPRRVVTSSTAALASDTLIGVDVSAGPVAITLPPANSVVEGKVLVISHERGNAAAFSIIIMPSPGDTINTSQSSLAITFGDGGGAAHRLYSDGVSKWRQW